MFGLGMARLSAGLTVSRLAQRSTWARSIATISNLPKNCPSCYQPLPSSVPACTKCGTIHNVPVDVNSFSLLGIPYEHGSFNLDAQVLRSAFRKAQIACHPDAWTALGNEKKDVAQELSSRVNTAYQRLKDPLKRLHYWLELNGHPMEETDKLEDNDFLTEVLMARDIVEESESPEEMAEVQDEFQAKWEESVFEISKLISEKNWGAAKQAGLRLKYVGGVLEAITERKRNGN